MMTPDLVLPAVDLAGLRRLAREVAFIVARGDLVTLGGDVGAGKTTFARALIAALMDSGEEVTSPTFNLVQIYATPRVTIAHVDLYRLSHEDELHALGLDEMLAEGAVIMEWPDRAGALLPVARLDIRLDDPPDVTRNAADFGMRRVSLAGHGGWASRASRLARMHRFLQGAAHAEVSYLQGDASVRRYGRVTNGTDSSAILMDWARQPDGPPIRDGRPYSAIAHLAENVQPYVAVADALRGIGLATPAIVTHDLDHGFLLLEDFGDRTFYSDLRSNGGTGASGHGSADFSQSEAWRAATDVLIALRRELVPETLPLPGGSSYRLPSYDRDALGIEVELLLDWYWPAAHGEPVPDEVRREFLACWSNVFDRLLAMPAGWVLRDFHSPNLMWLGGNSGIQRVGILDFQDAMSGPSAYDLVSLLQDARVDVPESLEASLFGHYCDAATDDPNFDRASFAYAYAALGLQRNTKVLGIFARLARRDGKPRYLAHIPRLWRYVGRDLAHPELADLRAWYDTHLPRGVRERPLPLSR